MLEIRQPSKLQDPWATQSSLKYGNRLMHYLRPMLVLLVTAAALLGMGCNPIFTAPPLEYDQQNVDEIRSQIDQFEWE